VLAVSAKRVIDQVAHLPKRLAHSILAEILSAAGTGYHDLVAENFPGFGWALGLNSILPARVARLAVQYTAGLVSRPRLAFALRWSVRRRRHQAAARWHHYSARLLATATG
jgi:hypothetical protein